MPYWRLSYHLIWSTKYRQPTITPEIEALLYPCLRQRADDLGVRVYALDGWVDHIHLVVSIPPKLSVAEVVRNLTNPAVRSQRRGTIERLGVVTHPSGARRFTRRQRVGPVQVS